ncbi:ParB/RepB/Spo0J family partition protein [Photobacterium toruni]|uniref:ParB/RepB/Spo0J family partition protein n=1 Tax=Photobacterium toruni TaxID=1935446 RepID=UPI00210F6A82|nr:ParB/RepB/Spo0J family partition protein [Photobacterium toruni]
MNKNIVTDANFDFSKIANGAAIRVDPTIIDDLSIGGNHRRNESRSEEFLDSIKTKGILQSLTVRPNPLNKNRLELCAGYGRRNAAIQLGISDVPVVVFHYNDKEALEAQLAENKQRSDISIVDEADLAQSYYSLTNGDLKQAALTLGVSEAVFRDRLQLKRCTEAVLDALADPSTPVTAGHALVLSTFDEKMQNITLDAIIKDPNTYTVKELKIRASKRLLPLANAPFNKTECATCIHNTGEQLSLMAFCDDNDSDQKCSNPACFDKKAKEWVATTRKSAIEEKYGKTILWDVKPESDRIEVKTDAVGEQQYNGGCLNCENKVNVVDDRPMRWGNFLLNQCIDTDCYKQCVRKRQEKEAEEERLQIAADKEKENAQKAAADEKSRLYREMLSGGDCSIKEMHDTVKTIDQGVDDVVKQQQQQIDDVKNEYEITAKQSTGQQQDNRLVLRTASAKRLSNDPQFRMALTLASLAHSTGYKELGSHSSLTQLTATCMKLSIKDIQLHMTRAVEFFAYESEANNATDLMIHVLSQTDDSKTLATNEWQPTDARLSIYNIAQIKQLCSASGFAVAYEQQNGDGSFDKLFKMKKTDITKKISSFNYDWTDFAPKTLIKQLK